MYRQEHGETGCCLDIRLSCPLQRSHYQNVSSISYRSLEFADFCLTDVDGEIVGAMATFPHPNLKASFNSKLNHILNHIANPNPDPNQPL